MRNFCLAVLAAFAVSCTGGSTTPPVQVGPTLVARPGETFDVTDSFAKALSCSPAALVWSIQESANSGFVSPRDGAISQVGVFAAPLCGSTYMGAVEHIQASGCGKTGVATVTTAQELLKSISVAYAIGQDSTGQACWASRGLCTDSAGAPTTTACDPRAVVDSCASGTVCNLQVPFNEGGSGQFFAQLNFTCGPQFPAPLPTTLPPPCP